MDPPDPLSTPSRPGTADHGPVARVVLDVSLAHLDRPFDYSVPEAMSASAVPGVRVVVPFAGRETAGFVVARIMRSDHPGVLTPLRRVVSPVPVLTPDVLALCRAVADRYAGTLADVLRLAVPKRHARTEAAVAARGGAVHDAGAREGSPGTTPTSTTPTRSPASGWSRSGWSPYRGGEAFLRRLAAGRSPRAVWSALPGEGPEAPEARVADAVRACLASGRGAVVVVPDARDVDRFAVALSGAGVDHVRLSAEAGPPARYRAFLTALHGRTRVVLGTRSAAFAPVDDLGLVVCWDDGDDALAEPRAPYPRALEVLITRARLTGAGALIGGFARSTASELLVHDGWARAVAAPREVVRATTARVSAPGEPELAREGPAAAARIPHPAWETARAALATGPVLVQVPHRGYVPVTACAHCRTPAHCRACRGPLRITGPAAVPTCAWCGRPATGWSCPDCGSARLRALRLGSERTAEELGRAFSSVPVTVSGAQAPGGVIDAVGAEPRIVVATPGAEPHAAGGYAAALLLDAAATAGRVALWAGEEAIRRWLAAAALVRPGPAGGRVMLLGNPPSGAAQALVRWDPSGYATRELAERAALRLPPAAALASLEGPPRAVAAFLERLSDLAPGDAQEPEVLGPVPVEPTVGPDVDPSEQVVRAIVRVERRRAEELARALAATSAARSARKDAGAVRVQVDPTALW